MTHSGNIFRFAREITRNIETMIILNKKGVAIIEYTLLFIIIIGAFLVMRNYIQRGVYNNWARTGQSLAFGRQHDAQKTIDCSFDEQLNKWYDHNCYNYYIEKNKCKGDIACEKEVINSNECRVSSCEQLNNGAVL